MLEAFVKNLKVIFFPKNIFHSPSTNSKNAPAMANSGAHATQQIFQGDVYNFHPEKNFIENEASWEHLIDCFTRLRAKWLTNQVNNQKLINFDRTIQSFEQGVLNKFEKINIHSVDPRAKSFLAIQREMCFSIQNYLKFRDEAEFEAKWMSLRDKLIWLRNNKDE